MYKLKTNLKKIEQTLNKTENPHFAKPLLGDVLNFKNKTL